MNTRNPQKIKLLRILDILQRETDREHPISRTELCRRLNGLGISSNPRTLTLDINALIAAGYSITSLQQGHQKCYYSGICDFSIPELKILIDAVEAASFVSESRTRALIEKITSLGGMHRSEALLDNMVHFNTRKHSNESIFDSISIMEQAIKHEHAITFKYFDLDEKAERIYRTTEDGSIKIYNVEPVSLVFSEDNYYLIAFSPRHPDSTANYRIDRMSDVNIVADSHISKTALTYINNVGLYTEQVFRMFNGEQMPVTLEFEKDLLGSVYDKFGESTRITVSERGTLKASVRIRVSPVFFGWVFQFGGRMRIISPEKLIEQYDEFKKL